MEQIEQTIKYRYTWEKKFFLKGIRHAKNAPSQIIRQRTRTCGLNYNLLL